MKKYFYAAISIIFSLALPSSVLAATLSLNPASGTFNKGCSVSIQIVLDTQGANQAPAQTDGTDAIITYSPSIFTISSDKITANTQLYQDYPGNNVDTASGKISVSGLASTSQPFSGKGTLATLNFLVATDAPAGPATLKFDFDPNNKSKTTDSNVVEHGTVADLLSAVTDGSYTIGTGSCSSSTSTVVIASPTTTTTGTTQQTVIGKGGVINTTTSGSAGTKTALPQSGLSGSTMIFGGIGLAFVVLGVIGVVLF